MLNRTYAVVDLDAAAFNMREIKNYLTGNTQIMAVVKADAYGHGVIPMSQVFLENGAERLAVAFIEEAIQIRNAGITAPVVLLGYTDGRQAEMLLNYDVIPTVFDYETAKAFSDCAVLNRKKMKIHLKLDTGMTRIGFFCNTNEDIREVKRQILKIASLPMLEIEGIFTHFTTADEPDDSYTEKQYSLFCRVTEELEREGLHIPLKHVCNSAATLLYPHMHLNLVRPGIIQYGMPPSDYIAKKGLNVKPVMSLKSKIVRIQQVPAGTCVGYGNTYISDKEMKIATIPIGYADGLFRGLSNCASVYAGEKFCSILGRICMDQCMIDVTSVNNISTGDEITVFGKENNAHELAKCAGTISYELLCAVGKRVPRVYIQNNQVIKATEPLLF